MTRTPSVILGPFYRGPTNGYEYSPNDNYILPGRSSGNLWLRVHILDDATNATIHFASVEVWQADPNGLYDNSNARDPASPTEFWPDTAYYRGRFRPYGAGHFGTLYTVVPGRYYQPPVGGAAGFTRERHIHFRISKPGYESLVTQVFLPREPNDPPIDDPFYLPANTVTTMPPVHDIVSAYFVFRL